MKLPRSRVHRVRPQWGAVDRSHLNERSWRDTDFVVIDLETTGLDPRRDRIVSYGAVPIRAGRIRVAEAVYGLVKTSHTVPGESTRIHGIRSQDLLDAPPLSACVKRLDAMLLDTVVVAHGAWIERSVLRRAFQRSYLSFDNPIVDTAPLACSHLELSMEPGTVVSLEYAATALGLPIHTPHHALGDALTTAGLFIALAGRLEGDGDLSTSRLLELSIP